VYKLYVYIRYPDSGWVRPMDNARWDFEISDTIRSLYRVIKAIHGTLKASGAFPAKGPHLEALRIISEGGSLSVGELSRKVGLSPAATTKLVDWLEGKGYASRSRDIEDRRVVKIHVTASGKDLVQKPFNPVPGTITAGLGSLRTEQLHVIRRSVERVADIVEAASWRPRSFLLMKNGMFPAG